MREILFRGKRTDNAEWVEGHYHYSNWYLPPSMKIVDTTHHILPIGHGDSYKVAPETVGQFTGLTDKNGKKIFEGDIVDILTENEEIGVVEYEDGGFLVSADGFCVDFHSNINGTDLEVIGNIHDNPELLGGAEDG